MHFVKDIDYIPADVRIAQSAFEQAVALGGGPLIASLVVQSFLRTDGMQLRVERILSAELDDSDFHNIEMDGVAWPAKAVEFFFDDPELPTITVLHATGSEIQARFPFMEEMRDTGPRVTALMQTSAGVQCVLNVWKSQWADIVLRHKIPDMNDAIPLSSEENDMLLRMLILALKVLAYCSLPRYATREINVTPTRKEGGKIGFKNRPRIPMRRVVYMPMLHTPRPKTLPVRGITREFRGRRGFFRFFTHDRFVNMKGRWMYVAPVRVAGAPLSVGIVRKVSS